MTIIFGSSVQFSSVVQSCPTLCDPMNRSTPGLPVHHQLQEFTQTHVHRVSDAIQPSHPLSSPSPPAPKSLPASVFSNESTLHMRWPKYWSFSFRASIYDLWGDSLVTDCVTYSLRRVLLWLYTVVIFFFFNVSVVKNLCILLQPCQYVWVWCYCPLLLLELLASVWLLWELKNKVG